jgi:abortive infection bacteriophage resistance protein
MGNIAINFTEQIKKLKSRGIDFNGFTDDKVKEILLDIGYYRLGFYWFDLKKDSNSHDFIDGTKFQTIIDLYYLDNDIRYILTKYLNRIEINFRTSVVYYVSNKYKEDPTWFVNDKIMQKSFIVNFDKYYNDDFKQLHFVIKNHHKKYPDSKYAPAWKTLENFPFGSIFKIFESLTDEQIKKRISEKFGITNILKFEKTFRGIVHIRNRCAHGAILYNYYLPKSMPTLPLIVYQDDNRNNLRVVIQVVEYFLEHISKNRKNDFIKDINDCLNNIKQSNEEAFDIYTSQSGLNFL